MLEWVIKLAAPSNDSLKSFWNNINMLNYTGDDWINRVPLFLQN